jgi:hypothetical protein
MSKSTPYPYTIPDDNSLKYKLAWYVIKQTNAGVNIWYADFR